MILLQGNTALAEAAVRAGCRHYFGYPITPQNEIPAYLARRLPEAGGTFVQAESEIAAICMAFGAAATGARVLTTTSSPGFSLKQEGISYLAGAHLPCVIANIQRAGPGLGGIGPAQGDYWQSVKGGGHGDYRLVVLAPASVQEMADFTVEAFALADAYRAPVLLLADGAVGQMMEAVTLPEPLAALPAKPWAVSGARGREPNIIRSFFTTPEEVLANNERLQATYRRIRQEVPARCEEYLATDAEVLFVAYGIAARVARAAVQLLRERGRRAGLLRPQTLWPFPEEAIARRAARGTRLLTVELNYGQMVEDVRLAAGGRAPVGFCGCAGGMLPDEDLLVQHALAAAEAQG